MLCAPQHIGVHLPYVVSRSEMPQDARAAQLEPRSAANESFFFHDAPQLPGNTSSPYDYARGLSGVDQRGNFFFVHVSLVCFFTVALAFLVLRLSEWAVRRLRLVTTLQAGSNQTFWTRDQSRWWPWIKNHVAYAPLWRKRHNQEIQLSRAISVGTLPSRFHTFLLVAYLTTNIAYCLALPWSVGSSNQVVAALRGRSGVLAAYNLIPLFLFAGRNNPLLWLLGISYDTFNLLHRWIARIVVLESLIHTACWFHNTYAAGKWPAVSEALDKVISYKFGMVAMAVMLFMVLAATSPLRHAFYEIFLAAHKFLAVISLSSVYIHIADHRLPQLSWIQVTFLLLGWEYSAQLARVVYYNVRRQRMSSITVEAMPAEASRVTIELARPMHVEPGSHAHIRIPSIAWYSSHPFSIAWTSKQSCEAQQQHDPEKGVAPRPVRCQGLKSNQISFVIRARTGFTRRIYDLAASQPSRKFTALGLVEGPYGVHAPLDSYGTVVLFAGGVGITHQVGFVKHLVEGHANGTVSCRRVRLIWSTPTRETLEWIRPWMDEILRMPGRRQVLQIDIFITKPRGRNELISGSGTLRTFPGRCNPATLIEQEMKAQVGSMAVSVCGPGAFADGVRAGARKFVQKGYLDFFEEAFTY